MKRKVSFFLVVLGGLYSVGGLAAGDVAVEKIIQNCEYKNPGSDQRSVLTIELIDKDGNQRKNVYRRFWKNHMGEGGIADKMVLFTEFPPDAKGTGFMRWGYAASENKMADQWLYLPHLRKVRRVSVRDPGDSFLGSDLTYGDIEDRSIGDDTYDLLEGGSKNGVEFYQVEIKPKEDGALYSKKISWYKKDAGWESCVRVKTDYYDRQGNILKKQKLTWQKVADAWVWDRVLVNNIQTGHKSIFTIEDVRVNVGVSSRIFTERALKKGM